MPGMGLTGRMVRDKNDVIEKLAFFMVSVVVVIVVVVVDGGAGGVALIFPFSLLRWRGGTHLSSSFPWNAQNSHSCCCC